MWLLEKDLLELEESEKLLQPLVIIQNKLKFRVNSLYSVMAERLCLIYPPPTPTPPRANGCRVVCYESPLIDPYMQVEKFDLPTHLF
jgi:hypothetical protein